MHIVIDCRFQTCSGIGRYIREIVSRLIQDANIKFSLIVDDTNIDSEFMEKCKRTNVSFIICRAKMYSVREQLEIPWKIPSCDIFWALHYNAPVFPVRAKRKIVTIHDVAHLAIAEELRMSIIKKCYAKLFMHTATHYYDVVLTVSQFTKKEILRYETDVADKIKVHTEGVDFVKFQPVTDEVLLQKVREKYRFPERFFLYVGNVKPHKNLKRLIQAYALLVKHRLIVPELVIVGKSDGFITGEGALGDLISQLNLQDHIFFTGYIDDADMPAVYRMAYAFVFPSLYEGFGLPPLEAMACGCPVIASDAASIPEICGNAARYFSPENIEEIAEALKSSLVQPYPREELKRLYNWDICAEQIKGCLHI